MSRLRLAIAGRVSSRRADLLKDRNRWPPDLRMQTGHELLLDPIRRVRHAETAGVQVKNPIVVDREGGKGGQRTSYSGICGLEPVATLLAGNPLPKLLFAAQKSDHEQACP